LEAVVKDKYRFVIGALILFLMLSAGLLWVAPGPLFPLIMDDFDAGRASVSWLTSIVSLIMGLGAIPASIMASKIGLKRTFAIGAFFMASAVLTPFTSNLGQLLATRILFAIGTAMTFPVGGGLVMQWFKGRELPLFNGLNTSFISLGNTIVLFTAVIVASAFSWKAAITTYGVICLTFAFAWAFLGREHREQAPETSGGSPPPESVVSVLKRKTTILLGFTVAGPFIMFMAISSWLPTYYNEVFGIPLAQASSITGLFPIFGIAGCILGGVLSMRTGLRKPFVLIPGFIIGFAGMGTFLVNNPAINYVSVALFGLVDYMFVPVIFTICMELPGITPATASILIAAMLGIGNVLGFTGPMLVGALRDMTGSYVPGLLICSILGFSLFIGGLFLPETGPKAKRARPS
jgi:CP family cyanate transporter-like MFS transporter